MTDNQTSRPKGSNTRWMISSLLCSMVMLNYFDRVAVSIAAPDLQHSFGLTAFEIGLVFSIYNYSYTLMQLPIGYLLDKKGVSPVVRTGLVIWSLLTIVFAFIQGKLLLYILRFFTGMASAAAFPAASKATANWFPAHERGLANALFDSSAKLSNVIGAPLVALIISFFDWRVAVLSIGIMNVLFTVIFWRNYAEPKNHKKVSERELHYIRDTQESEEVSYPFLYVLKKLFSSRKVWGVTIGFTGYGYTFNLLLMWLPTFFKEQFKLDSVTTSLLVAIPWLIAALVGILVGGWLVDILIRKGVEENKVYRRIIITGFTVGLVFLGSIFTDNPIISMFCITIGLAGISATAPIGWSIVSKIAPPGTNANMSAIINFSNNLFGGIIASLVTGYIIDVTGSFNLAFLIAGAVLIIGIFFYTVVLGKMERIVWEEE
ncbi:MFS transporter [Bacillus sp. 1P06AnD]|uniref:MFS transporter n=1 Tax=Bacillus sp. 1P06AnD TaxID=3132208 RepID=UPI0039A251D0